MLTDEQRLMIVEETRKQMGIEGIYGSMPEGMADRVRVGDLRFLADAATRGIHRAVEMINEAPPEVAKQEV